MNQRAISKCKLRQWLAACLDEIAADPGAFRKELSYKLQEAAELVDFPELVREAPEPQDERRSA